MAAYYNEHDAAAAQWLRNLIAMGAIAPGDVDERSITEVQPDDLRGYVQCHFFAGIGGWSLAARLAGWPDDRPLWTGSCPCFTAGHLVLTDKGLAPIETVTVGDRVWTHAGRWRRVVRAGSEFKTVGTLAGHGHFGLVVTPEHPFLARTRRICGTRRNGRAVRVHHVSDPGWTPAQEMPGQWWALASLPFAEAPAWFDTRAAFLAGLYVGDGWLGRGPRENQILLGLNEEKRDRIWDRLGTAGTQIYAQDTGVRMCIPVAPAFAGTLQADFGVSAPRKRIPLWLMTADREVQQAFLDGWDLTDGTRALQTGSRRLTTVSRDLAITGRMLLSAMGFAVSLRKVVTPPKTVIQGREVNQRDYYTISRSLNNRYLFRNEHVWQKAKTWTPAKKGAARIQH